MDWTQILVSILGGGGFLGGIVSLVNMKPSRKKAMAEARTVEITNLEKSISIMEKSYSNIQTYVNKEVTRIENDLSELKKSMKKSYLYTASIHLQSTKRRMSGAVKASKV